MPWDVSAKFCSLQCRYDSQKGKFKIPRINKICINCGKRFIWVKDGIHHKGKFCSKKCRNEFGVNRKYPIKKVICSFCGKEFYKNCYQYKGKWKNIYCSKDCYDKHRKKSRTKICINCNKEYQRISYNKNSKPLYCSIKCRDEYRKKQSENKKNQICSNCGKVIKRKTPATNFILKQKVFKNEFFCSFKCLENKHHVLKNNQYKIKRKKGKEHHWYGRKLTETEKEKLSKIAFDAYEDDNHCYKFFKGQYCKYVPKKFLTLLDEKTIKANILIHKIRRSLNVNK